MTTANSLPIFQQFIEALTTLLLHPDTPPMVRKAFKEAAEIAVDYLGGYQYDAQEIRVALLRGFALHCGQEKEKAEHSVLTPDQPFKSLDEDEEDLRAYREISDAIAKIERHRAYLPTDFYNSFGDCVNEWIDLAQWTSEPELISEVLPLLLSHIKKNAPQVPAGGTA